MVKAFRRLRRVVPARPGSMRRHLLDAITCSGPVVVLRLDNTGITYASPNAATLLGISPEQARRPETWLAAAPADLFETLRTAVRGLLTGETTGPIELEGEVNFGVRPRVLQIVLNPEPTAGRRIRAVFAFLQDVTERRAAERTVADRERQLRAITSASPDVIAVVGPDLRVRFVSDASTGLTGIRASDRIGARIGETVHPDDRPALLDGIRAVLTGAAEDFVVRVRTRHASGRYIVLEGHGRPALGPDGAPTAAVIVFRDISERLALEAELVRAKEAADAASAAKSDFLSRMSHELRTPLNVILGFSQLLQMERLTDEQQEWVNQIFKAGRHLLDLINEVLDITRIESGRLALSLEAVSLRDVIGETMVALAPLAAEREVTADWVIEDDDVTVRADRQRLRQVMLNLVVNAIKYNRRGGTVLVSARRCADRALIRVADTGIGIAPEHIERLFVPFDRLGADAIDAEGTGVGLPLTLRLVQAMDGELTVDSTPGEGSVFTVALPLAAPMPLDPKGPAESAHDGAPAATGTVLYIDDNDHDDGVLRHIVALRPGIRWLRAECGSKGMELLRRESVDLVFLDVHLPDMSGFDVLREVRRDPLTAALPVYMVSADATSGQAQRMRSLDATGFVPKPVDVPRLLGIVDSVLRAKSDGREG